MKNLRRLKTYTVNDCATLGMFGLYIGLIAIDQYDVLYRRFSEGSEEGYYEIKGDEITQIPRPIR